MPNLDRDFYLDKQGLRQLINELETNIVALEYDTSVSYSVGDYCVYENNLYRCTTATTGAWDSTAWVKVVISDEIPSIKSITTAQWEALTPEQKASGDYVITDATTVPLTAENVPYDDTVSGLTADNVQDAIDELASGGGSGSGIYSVIGTQTAATSAWTGVLHGVSALYDGLTINYYVPQNSVINTNVTLNLTLDSGSSTGAIGVYRNGGMQYTYGYNAGNSVILTYFSAGSISINGTATLVDMWINDAYVNDKAEQKPTNSENVNFPIALSLAFGRRATEAVYSDYPNFTYNPSTKSLSLTVLNGVTIRDITNNAGFHNSIYRGKLLGTSVSAEQYAQISAGTFDDMFIGDYWTISTTINGTTTDINYVIAGFDYYINSFRNTEHHLILVPSDIIGTARMNDTDTTYPQGYFASEMYQTTLPAYKTGIQNAFGSSHTYYVYRFYPAAVSPVGQAIRQGYVNDDYLFFMSETMVSGRGVWSTSGYETMADRTILPLFALNPESAVLSTTYWLMTVASPTQFSTVTSTGAIGYAEASASAAGIRPAFVIYGGSNT